MANDKFRFKDNITIGSLWVDNSLEEKLGGGTAYFIGGLFNDGKGGGNSFGPAGVIKTYESYIVGNDQLVFADGQEHT